MTKENQVNAMYVAQNGTIDSNLGSITYSSATNGNGLANSTLGAGIPGGTKTNSLYNGSCWDFWQNQYYPQVIRESYPVYIQNRAEDKGKQAFEIIKQLQDKRLMKLDKVSDFIDAMDCLIKIL